MCCYADINFQGEVLSYIIKSSLFVCLPVCLPVCFLVRNRLQNHAYYGDEAFAGDSVGLGLGQRLNFFSKKVLLGHNRPCCKKYSLHHKNVLLLKASLLLIPVMNGNQSDTAATSPCSNFSGTSNVQRKGLLLATRIIHQ